MRNLLVMSLVLASQCFTTTGATDLAPIYVSQPSMPPFGLVGGDECRPTSAPLVVSPSEIFAAYWCPKNPKGQCTLWHYDSTLGGRWTLKYVHDSIGSVDCFPEPALLVYPSTIRSTIVATFTTIYDAKRVPTTWVMAFNNSRTLNGPIWTYETFGNTAGIAVDPVKGNVFYGCGDHTIPAGDIVTSIECVNGMTGNTVWANGTQYTKGARLSQPVYYEESVYFLYGASLHRLPADTGKINWSPSNFKADPCFFDPKTSADGGWQNPVKMKLVQFGYEPSSSNGGEILPLSGLFLYGNVMTTRGLKVPHFSFCRVHHGSYKFGEGYQIQFSEAANMTLLSLSGGDNATILTFAENQEVRIYNTSNTASASSSRLVTKFTRPQQDLYMVPTVLYYSDPKHTQTKAPLIVFGQSPRDPTTAGGFLHARNTWTKAIDWTTNVYCSQSGTLGCRNPNDVGCGVPGMAAKAQSVMFCVGGNTPVTSQLSAAINYSGDVLWRGGMKSKYAPIAIGDSQVFYSDVMIESVSALQASKNDYVFPTIFQPPKSKGGNAGVVVLSIFLVLVALVLVAGIARYVFRRTTNYNPLRLGADASGGEEGTGSGGAVKTGSPTAGPLSSRSLQDTETGGGGGTSGYGGINE